MNEKPRPLFPMLAGETLHRCIETFEQREQEYGDTWRNNQWLISKSVLEKFGANLTTQQLRIAALAMLCDVKYSRNEGGWKEDTHLDYVNYCAALVAEMRDYESKLLPQITAASLNQQPQAA